MKDEAKKPVTCQCEHDIHFGGPGHKYGAEVSELVPVKTPYGTFHVCNGCAEICLASYKVPERN